MLISKSSFILRTQLQKFLHVPKQSRCVTMIKSKTPLHDVTSFETKNRLLNRPLSPHLSIYKFQLTSMLSITHRFTGVALTAYAAGFAILSISPMNTNCLVESINSLDLSSSTLYAAKVILALPITYHTCNGVRHLIWDFGKALSIKGVYTSGYIMLLSAVVSAFVLANI